MTEEIIEKKISRRRFIKLAAGAIVGITTGGLTSVLTKKVSPMSPEETPMSPEESETKPVPDLEWEVEGEKIPVFCLNKPLVSETELIDFRAWLSEGVELSKVDPRKRGLEYLVSKQAWDLWQNTSSPDHPMNGEELVPFVHRHLVELNKALANSGLSDIQTYLARVIIYDEEKNNLANNFLHSQLLSSADVFGSWGIDSRYKPKDWAHADFDDSLLHEWSHYLLYVVPHFSNYFNSDWENFLPTDQSQNCRLKGPKRLMNFQLLDKDATEPLDSFMLQHAHPDPNNLRFTPIEGLAILRAVQESERMLKKNLIDASYRTSIADRIWTRNILWGKDLAPTYNFLFSTQIFGPGKATARVYESGLYDENCLGDNIHWQIQETPLQESTFKTGSEPLTIRKDLLKGGAKTVGTGNENGIAKLFILEVEGENGVKKNYAFTTWHLFYWHWKRQFEKAQAEGKEPVLGSEGKQLPILIKLD